MPPMQITKLLAFELALRGQRMGGDGDHVAPRRRRSRGFARSLRSRAHPRRAKDRAFAVLCAHCGLCGSILAAAPMLVFAVLLVACPAFAETSPPPRKPHIVLFISDDHSWHDV